MGRRPKRKREKPSPEEIARNVRPILTTNEPHFLISHVKYHETTTQRVYLDDQPEPVPLAPLPAPQPADDITKQQLEKDREENNPCSKRTQVSPKRVSVVSRTLMRYIFLAWSTTGRL